MGFLAPAFLLGLLALAVPLWLHRLEQAPAERRVWSSLALFRASAEESVRRRRLRYLALLACRLLLVALLALAFARPVLNAGVPLSGLSGERHVIALDTSLSMAYGDTWARAVEEVEAVLGRLGSADRSQLLAFGPGVTVLGAPTSNHGTWRPALPSLAPTGGRASYGELGEAVRTLARDEAAPLHLHVVSDFQRSSAPARFADLGLPAGATLVAHGLETSPRPNWSIESVGGRVRVHGAQRPEIHATVAGFDTPAALRRLELYVGGARVASQDVAVSASGRATVRFADLDVVRGQSRAELRLVPADALPADDVSYVTLERTDAHAVLFVRAPTETRAELYYRAALESGGDGAFEVQAMTPSAAQAIALDRFAFVVLHDVARPPALLETRVREFVQEGKAALVILGAASAGEASVPWIPGALRDSTRAERSQHGTAVRAAHPALSSAERLHDVRVFRHVRVPAVAENVLVRLADGAPLLFESPLGRGRLLVLASPLDTQWNDWPLQVSFVPFATASARWLAGDDGGRGRWTVGDRFDLGAAGDGAVSVTVIAPDGRRALGLAESLSARALPLTRAGFYEVRWRGRSEWVAVNPDARESDLHRLDAEAVERWRATAGTAAPATATAAGPPPREASHRLLWLLLAIALVESTLANRYLRGREAPGQAA